MEKLFNAKAIKDKTDFLVWCDFLEEKGINTTELRNIFDFRRRKSVGGYDGGGYGGGGYGGGGGYSDGHRKEYIRLA